MARQQLQCPTCGRPIEWSEAFAFRPFCGERCRLIDLGAWLSEKHAIPGETTEHSEAADTRTARDASEVEGEDDSGASAH